MSYMDLLDSVPDMHYPHASGDDENAVDETSPRRELEFEIGNIADGMWRCIQFAVKVGVVKKTDDVLGWASLMRFVYKKRIQKKEPRHKMGDLNCANADESVPTFAEFSGKRAWLKIAEAMAERSIYPF